MKKQKALEDMTHLDLVAALLTDENISDNVEVSDDYAPDKFGNNLVTVSFEGVAHGKKKGVNGLLLFTFNPQGRLVSLELATCQKDKKNWQIAASEKFVDFKKDWISKGIIQ